MSVGPLNTQTCEGVLAAFNVARTTKDRAEASAELRLGQCGLTLEK